MPQLLKLVTSLQIQRPVATIRANSSRAATLGIFWFQGGMGWGGRGLCQLLHLLYLCFNTAFVAASVLNLALGIWVIQGMGRFRCLGKIKKISWYSIQLPLVFQMQVHPLSVFFFSTEIHLEIIKRKQYLSIASFRYSAWSICKPGWLVGPNSYRLHAHS